VGTLREVGEKSERQPPPAGYGMPEPQYGRTLQRHRRSSVTKLRLTRVINAKDASFFRLRSLKTVMQPRVSIRPLKFECPACGSTWQEEIIFTPGSIVFKKAPCPKCGDERKMGSIAA